MARSSCPAGISAQTQERDGNNILRATCLQPMITRISISRLRFAARTRSSPGRSARRGQWPTVRRAPVVNPQDLVFPERIDPRSSQILQTGPVRSDEPCGSVMKKLTSAHLGGLNHDTELDRYGLAFSVDRSFIHGTPRPAPLQLLPREPGTTAVTVVFRVQDGPGGSQPAALTARLRPCGPNGTWARRRADHRHHLGWRSQPVADTARPSCV
jgi:hypothetical protein